MAKVISLILTKFLDSAVRTHVRDDDFIDQLNHWATAGILTALAIGVGAKQFVGEPIHCWIPAEYKKKDYQKYSDSYCWIYPMYSFSFDEPIPAKASDRWFNDISYYRWVFIMFLLQAFMFKFPNLIWKHLKNYCGLNVAKLIGMAWDTNMLTQDKRDEKMEHMAVFIDKWLTTYTQYKYNVFTRFRDKFSRVMFCFGKHSGTYLNGLYMFVKLLYMANVIGQFFLLSSFLDLNFWMFGLSAMKTLNKQGHWEDYENFPRIGLCDYKIRQLQNLQTYTVQCVLSINLFLEKMYLILWFWLILMVAFDSVNLLQWIIRGLRPHSGESFLVKYLHLMDVDTKEEKKDFVRFVHSYLRSDGVFMLRMVAENTSEIMVLDLIKHLWKKFKELHCLKDADADQVVENGAAFSPGPSAPSIDDEDEDFEPIEPKKIL
nr:Limax innexin 10 [Ambigolimax valentianus]